MSTPQTMQIYITCPPGLEPVLKEELAKLRLTPISTRNASQESAPDGEERGGVEIEGTLDDIYRCNLYLRSASRVVVRLGSFWWTGHAVNANSLAMPGGT